MNLNPKHLNKILLRNKINNDGFAKGLTCPIKHDGMETLINILKIPQGFINTTLLL